MSADTVPAAMPGDLADRCRELLAWGKTGLLQGEAIRAYAEEHFSHFEREADRIAQAERATNKQAMEAVLGFAQILAEKERLERERDEARADADTAADAARYQRERRLEVEAAIAKAENGGFGAAIGRAAVLHNIDLTGNQIKLLCDAIAAAIRAQGT